MAQAFKHGATVSQVFGTIFHEAICQTIVMQPILKKEKDSNRTKKLEKKHVSINEDK